MKKIYYLIMLLLFISMASNAQVRIGNATDPHDGAILDLKSSETATKGLLLPNVNLIDLNTFQLATDATGAKGMMVYNTNETIGKGVYVWTDSKWNIVKGDPEEPIDPDLPGMPGDWVTSTGSGNGFFGTAFKNICPEPTVELTTKSGYSFGDFTPNAATLSGNKLTFDKTGRVFVTKGEQTGAVYVEISNCEVLVDEVIVTGSDDKVDVGKTLALTASFLPTDATLQEVTWKTSSDAIATINANGVLTGVSGGNVTVTATAKDAGKVEGYYYVTVIPQSTGSLITAPAPAADCTGSSFALSASASGVNTPTFRWYSSATSTDVLYTGANYTVSPTETTTYYVSVSGTNYFEGENSETGRKAVTVTVKQISTADLITVSDIEIFIGSEATLTATASSSVINPVFRWYVTRLGTEALASNKVSPTVTTNYSVSVSGDNYCEGSFPSRKAVKVTVIPQSTGSLITAPAPAADCTGSSFALSASASGVNTPTFRWYSSATSTTVLYTGANYTVSPTETTTYYVSVSGTNYLEGENSETGRKAVTVTVKQISDASMITVSDQTINNGSEATLTATASGVTNAAFKWYDSATSTTVLSASASYKVSPTATTDYYVSVSGDNYCEGAATTSGRKKVTVTVRSTASMITASNQTINKGDEATLEASASGVTNATFKWYSSDTSTTALTSTKVTPAATTDYYVSVSGTNLSEGEASTTGRKKVTVTVRSTASMITASNQTINKGDEATLEASASGVTNATFKWYSSDTSTTALTSTKVTPAATTDYYVSVSGTNLSEGEASTTGRKKVTVTVRSIASMITATASSATICNGDAVTLSASAPGVTSPTYRWYSSASSTTVLATGASYSPSPSADITYYVSVSGNNYPEGSNNATGRKAVSVEVFGRTDLGSINTMTIGNKSYQVTSLYCKRCLAEYASDGNPSTTVTNQDGREVSYYTFSQASTACPSGWILFNNYFGDDFSGRNMINRILLEKLINKDPNYFRAYTSKTIGLTESIAAFCTYDVLGDYIAIDKNLLQRTLPRADYENYLGSAPVLCWQK